MQKHEPLKMNRNTYITEIIEYIHIYFARGVQINLETHLNRKL